MDENVDEVPTIASFKHIVDEALACGAKTNNPNVIQFRVEPDVQQISKNCKENAETSKVPMVATNVRALVCEAMATNTNEMHFSVEPNLEQIRESISNFAKERNWEQYHQPRNLLLAMVGEVGELSEIFQWKGEVKKGLPGWSEEEKEHLGQELSDVLLYLVRLSDTCHIDLPAAVVKKNGS
ncbi:hypothetical protein JTE90_028430 [Oedothorax gibbosus]|uniref:dCTP pyrophosphatase 1 n=1 Tax=Oedothorax gibbosus TaxID=931172 RepID=A0AAV6VF61_9ARAC|nr:hypothetical protein JTE90_028430 [Oedothorax gibbosus]